MQMGDRTGSLHSLSKQGCGQSADGQEWHPAHACQSTGPPMVRHRVYWRQCLCPTGADLCHCAEVTASHLGIYPIVLTGSSTIADPDFPARSFGSQLVRLYADPK